ncbi:efflux RND transporter periplasmic adaptor subunit [Cryomorpha ignava]|uniref:Efflux RND transporter periplasmic adaptor subunit n=1 Tax=Cryomorpha ignava TaxID=101383 RepID=A0A7K3WNP6_9FLAO|nr:efflux RND transporter periplasmic adaptor subunit [Cryomorpha ignava]NEN23277.1 efflux RND transporter periplasmic adaptor subunit [Cryomorpha ignava]
MKNLYKSILGFSFLFIAGCTQEAETNTTELPSVAVKVQKASGGEKTHYISASGQIEAIKSANISTRMMGYIQDIPVKTGQKVKKGDLLISISNTDLLAKKGQVEAGVLQAKAAYKNAEKDYERFQALFAKKSASQKELDDMTTRYEMAKAGLDAAREMENEVNAQFSYANIRAPFSGVVTNTFAKEGDMANPGMPLIGLEAPGKMEVAAMISEADIQNVHEGMKADVSLKSIGLTVEGVVSEVSLSAKNTGGQYVVKIDMEAPDSSIYAGMYANVQIHGSGSNAGDANRSVWIPEEALVHQGQLTGVYTIGNENAAILRWLRTGRSTGDEVEVLSGLKPDETFIISAEGRLYNGVPVTF